MSLRGLLAAAPLEDAAKAAHAGPSSIFAPAAVHQLIAARIAAECDGTPRLLVVTATDREADDSVEALRALLPDLAIEAFPAWETLPHERLSPSADTVGRRVAALRRLAHPEGPLGPIDVLVASVQALIQPIVAGVGEVEPVVLRKGGSADLTETVRRLVDLGYERVEMVDRRGQIAVRGGILDIFPVVAEHPVRVEFWGDEIEDLRSFSVVDQRTLESARSEVWAPAVRELLLTEAVRERARRIAHEHAQVRELAEAAAEGRAVEGIEALSAVIADGMTTLVRELPANTPVALLQPERLAARADDLVRTAEEFLAAAWHTVAGGGERIPLDLSGSHLLDLQSALEGGGRRIGITALQAEGAISVGATEVAAVRGDLSGTLEQIRNWHRQGRRIVILADGAGSAERIAESLRAEQLPARFEISVDAPSAGQISVSVGRMVGGWTLGDLVVLTESDITGQRSAAKDIRMPSRRRRSIDPLELEAGDFVVHEQHGVGRYVEMTQRTVGGASREYLVLEYAAGKRGQPADLLFVPTDQLDLVSRYVGGEAPSIHRLGGADWQKAKGRARKAVREIAGELIRLYAARQRSKGHAFGPDTPWQAELEDAFGYVETPDQLACIDEVKADMERQVPMDRLICGDVGYGKTEIAIRAAFKAVQEGKQVAVLVPTTLLVQQHLATFSERYAAFPVKVAGLSRFSTEAEAKSVIEGIADGTVDVVIGTHRLLTSTVRFKDLGLVIVDEEQRFGVEHKEHLKALRTNVDVLSMSATPIPRTLEMAVTGIREMSVIQTPPEERHPVLTFVGPYDDRQIAAAVRRELVRDGQAFFVHNRVESIERAAAKLRDLVPEARIAVAHGQMAESALEQVIVDFWERRIDLLVCTTIVESGIDIANANTLIVDRADTLGLAQLHQLRGRVGRGRERAYAYFLYNPDRPLSETAHDRLATIAQHSELGSGMHIALKDLEIRGAGNLLGGEQSGHIAEVGFDLYVRMVGEALAEATGSGAAEPHEMRVELPIDAYLPHDYIPHERLRLEAYKRLADAATNAEVDDVRAELLDRYGPLPAPVESLLSVARFRVLARGAGLHEVIAQGAMVKLHPVELPESGQMRLARLHPGALVKPAIRTILVPRPRTAQVGGMPVSGVQLLEWASELVRDVLGGNGSASGQAG